MAQHSALIRHWLHAEPAEDMQAFADQAAQALWLEQRHFEAMRKMFGGGK